MEYRLEYVRRFSSQNFSDINNFKENKNGGASLVRSHRLSRRDSQYFPLEFLLFFSLFFSFRRRASVNDANASTSAQNEPAAHQYSLAFRSAGRIIPRDRRLTHKPTVYTRLRRVWIRPRRFKGFLFGWRFTRSPLWTRVCPLVWLTSLRWKNDGESFGFTWNS